MAKTPPARLGSNPFAESALPWIRDTREDGHPSPPSPSPPPKQQPEAPSPSAAAASEAPSAKARSGATGKAAKPMKQVNTVNLMKQVKQMKHMKHEIQNASSNDMKAGSESKVIDEPRRVGRPKSNHRVISKSSQAGLPDGWTRATITVREEMLEILKRAAYWERTTIKKVIDDALAAHLDGKSFEPIPTEAT